MNLQCAAHISSDVSKYKTDDNIKEVIILDVFPMFIFTPYYGPSPPLWELVAKSMSYLCQFHNHQKGLIYVSVRSLLPD